MDTETLLKRGAGVERGKVLEALPDGRLRVALVDVPGGEALCELLHVAEGHRLALEPGDDVVVLLGSPPVVLGRIGAGQRLMPKGANLVLEAKGSLTIRCGESSITLREDGKLLIEGRDVVSSASRLNRIRGGAISLN